jgi:hypothetical protein
MHLDVKSCPRAIASLAPIASSRYQLGFAAIYCPENSDGRDGGSTRGPRQSLPLGFASSQRKCDAAIITECAARSRRNAQFESLVEMELIGIRSLALVVWRLEPVSTAPPHRPSLRPGGRAEPSQTPRSPRRQVSGRCFTKETHASRKLSGSEQRSENPEAVPEADAAYEAQIFEFVRSIALHLSVKPRSIAIKHATKTGEGPDQRV